MCVADMFCTPGEPTLACLEVLRVRVHNRAAATNGTEWDDPSMLSSRCYAVSYKYAAAPYICSNSLTLTHAILTHVVCVLCATYLPRTG